MHFVLKINMCDYELFYKVLIKTLIYFVAENSPNWKRGQYTKFTWHAPMICRHQMETFSALLDLCVHRSPVNFPHKDQWREALFSLICAWTNGWVNNRDTGDLRRHHAHYDVTVMGIGTQSSQAVQKPACRFRQMQRVHVVRACLT